MNGGGRIVRIGLACAFAILAMVNIGSAQPQRMPEFEGATPTEARVRDVLRRGHVADVNIRCRQMLDPRDDEELRWHDACRELSAAFLELLPTAETRQAKAQPHGRSAAAQDGYATADPASRRPGQERGARHGRPDEAHDARDPSWSRRSP